MIPRSRLSLRQCIDEGIQLPPEIEEGNVEYKLQLLPANEERLEHLCTQLQWRLTEFGECWYELGVSDDGRLSGIPRPVLNQSMETMRTMCKRVKAEISGFEKFRVDDGLYVAEIYLRPCQRAASAHNMGAGNDGMKEVRIAFVGESSSGKSTLISVLSYGQLDNGRGDARLSLLRHRHEILSGRTSSVAVEPIVLIPSVEGSSELVPLRLEAVESSDHLALSSRRLMLESPKVLQLFDLPGAPQYHRSTVSSLTSLAGPDLAVLVIVATGEGLEGAGEQLAMLRSLSVPFIIVLSKADLNPEGIESMASSLSEEYGCKVFILSATTGEGIPELQNHLIQFTPLLSRFKLHSQNSNIFAIESVKVSEDVGLVVKGAVLQGHIDLDGPESSWQVGPSPVDGSFFPVKLTSAHRLRLPVHQIGEGLMAAIALTGCPSSFNVARGMFLVNNRHNTLVGKTTSFIQWEGFSVIQGKLPSAPEKEIQGLLHCGCARVGVKAKLLGEEGGIVMETLDGMRLILVPGLKLVLASSQCVLAGVYDWR